jgi:flagellar basal-body rod modification protein FlgD
MATVSNATSAAAASSATSTNSSAARIADNFDQFLQLLTTQLKNQSPLDPLDTNQFTQQLVQFASVEQQIKTNDNLGSLLIANKTANVTSAMGFVGSRVTADGTTSVLKDGSAAWQLNAPRGGSAIVTIKDKSGNEVYTRNVTLTAGEQAFTWDGKKNDGSTAADGQYSIVVAAKDASSVTMNVTSELSGIVDAVDVTGDTPILEVGGIQIPVTSVKSVRR